MKVKLVFGILFLLISSSLFAQIGERRDFMWLLGYDSDLSTPEKERLLFDFNQKPLQINISERDMEVYLTYASICDPEGKLLFYTNGCYIADATHHIMENGEGLNPGEVHDLVCTGAAAGYSILQGALIIPIPNENDQYYLFHQRKTSIQTPVFTKVADPLFYSIIDMRMNNGLGAVIQKNVTAIADTLYGGHLTGVKHANGRWWWVIAPKWNSNSYYRLLIKDEGELETHSQVIGLPTNEAGDGSGQAVFSPDGKHYIRYNMVDQMYIFDFNRETGLLSNFRQMEVDTNGYQGGVAVSSDSRFLYVSPLYKVYQFDLWAQDISATKVQVAEYDGYTSPFPTLFWFMQLAPDCRIYIAPPNGSNVMHIIHQPNKKGLDCDLEQHGLQLPTYNATGMVNFPNYRLGTSEPTCDPSISTSLPFLQPGALSAFELSPNPAHDQLNIQLSQEAIMEGELVIYDALGKILLHQELAEDQPIYKMDISSFPSGIYFVSWQQEGQQVQSQKLVIGK